MLWSQLKTLGDRLAFNHNGDFEVYIPDYHAYYGESEVAGIKFYEKELDEGESDCCIAGYDSDTGICLGCGKDAEPREALPDRFYLTV